MIFFVHLKYKQNIKPMKISETSHTALVAALKEALRRYMGNEENAAVTDIHLQPRQDSGELLLFNDDDEELARTVVAEWADYEGDDFYTQTEHVLRSLLVKLKEEGAFNQLNLLKPYSFVLVDEDKETVAELLLLDEEDTLLLSEDLLKGLDEELDAFLNDLLSR